MKFYYLLITLSFVSQSLWAQTLENQGSYDLKGAGGFKTEEVESPKSKKTGVKFSEAYPEEINSKNYPDMLDTFDYPDIEIKDLVNVITQLTGKRFIMGDKISGKISIVSPGPITVAEAYEAFLSALQMNDLTIVPSGKFLKIVRTRDAIKDSIETYIGDYYPNSDQMITKIIKLKYIPVKELETALRSLYSKDGDLKAYEPTNSVILSDYGSSVEKILGIIKELDVPGFEEKMEVIKIRHASAKEVSELINKIINKGEDKSKIPRFRRSKDDDKNKGAVSLSYVTSDERTNSVIVLGNKRGIQKAQELVETLDTPLEGDQEGGVFVYYVKHNNAEDIAKTLGGIADESKKALEESAKKAGVKSSAIQPDAAPKTPSQVFGSEVSVKADKNTNSLIITASSQDYKKVMNILEKIDIARDQVFVETIIMEVSADNKRDIGLDIAKVDAIGGDSQAQPADGFAIQGMFGNDSKSGFAAFLQNPLSVLGGGILSFGAGKEKFIRIGDRVQPIKSVVGLVKLLQTYEIADVLSTPKIMALDNEEATLEVGQDIVIGQQQVNSAAGSTVAVQRKNVSTSLKITPSISPESNSVRLKIKQTVKDAVNAANPNTPINEKLLETNIVVPNGDTAVLGGLVNEKTANTTRKVPLLGDIPILGWLFRSNSKSVVKSNLTLFITPKIIRNPAQNRELLQGQIDKRLRFIKKNLNGVDPHGETIDEILNVKKGSATSQAPISEEDESWDDELSDEDKEFPAVESL